MNKSVIRVLAVFLTIAVMAGIFYGCGNKKDNSGIYVDPTGESYITVQDVDTGDVLVGFTGEDGTIYAAYTDEHGNVLKDGETFPVNNYDGTMPYNDTTAVSVDSGDDSHNWAGEDVVTVSKDQTTASNTAESKNNSATTTKKADTTTTTEAESGYLAEKYQKLFASGAFYIEFSTEDEDMPDPVTAAIKNGSIYMKTKFENMNCTLIYQKDKDKLYMVLTDFRVYCKMPSDMMEDLDLSNFSNTSKVKKVETYEAVLGNRECQCETYYLADGTISTFYFYNGELVRMDQIFDDGTSTVMNVNKISSQVDDSLFELPKLFVPLDLSNFNLDDLGE